LYLPYVQYGKAESYALVLDNAGAVEVPYAIRFESASGTSDSNIVRDQFARGDGSSLGTDWNTMNNLSIQGGRAVIGGTAAARALRVGFTSADVAAVVRYE